MKEKYNLPNKLTISDYEECVYLIKEHALKNNTIHSVYLMGGEWQPGISDLDIVVVYKDGVNPRYLKSPWSLGEKAKFIFTHRYLSFDETTAKGFYFLYPERTLNLRIICGEPVDFIRPNEGEEKEWTLIFIIFDVLVNKLLLWGRFKKPPYDIRNMIGELYSLIYTIDIIREITNKDIGLDFINRIKYLKKNWFNLEEDKAISELFSLLSLGMDIVLEIILILDKFLIEKRVYSQSNLVFSNIKYKVCFSDRWTKDLFFKNFRRSIFYKIPILKKELRSFNLILPSSFSFFFISYIKSKNEFSKSIRNCIYGYKDENEEIILKGVYNHIKFTNLAFISSVKTKGNFKAPFTFGLNFNKRKFKQIIFELIFKFMRHFI